MAGSMYTFEWPHGTPSLGDAARALRMREADLDRSFGVVLIDPAKREYTVLCNPGAEPPPGLKGPFANPAIGGFGPPRR